MANPGEPVPKTRLERRKLRTRRAILDAAAKLFREQGYAKTSIIEIADLADVGVGTLYGYFRSKHDLLQEVLRTHALEARERYRAAVDRTTPAVERVVKTLEEVARYMHENRVLLASAFREDGGDRQSQTVNPADWLFDALCEDIRRGIEKGELRKVPVEITALTLLTAYTSAALGLGVWRDRDREATLRELDAMTRAILAA
ncbi:MAG: TetR/AcrR family transcriptional regulator [Dehalococcoidia bacterium]|jgi:AcrR family transcriptional regulator|nr:TetR/AcrR family transcriptional regulator [Dehalococcoidia bacterium]